MDTAHTVTRLATAVVVLAGAAVTQAWTAGPAMASVAGLQVVSAVSPADSASPKSVAATCPTGTRVTGTGVYVDGIAGRIVVDDVIPSATTVRVTGYEDQDGTAASWWIRAFAVCANPLPGLDIVTATSAVTSDASRTVTAGCPSGKVALGGGAATTGGTGQVLLGATLPGGGGSAATAYEDHDGTAANWLLTSYAICAYPPAGLAAVTVKLPADSADKVAAPVCPTGTKVLGLGWETGGPEPGRVLVDIAAPTGTGALVAARENGSTVASSWTVAARVLCATP